MIQFLEKRSGGHPACTSRPQKLIHHAELFRHSQASAARTSKGPGPVQTGGRPWHHLHGAGSTGIQNVQVKGPWRIPLRFQRQGEEARQIVAGLGFLKDFFQQEIHEKVKVKPKMKWRPKQLINASKVENCWLQKELG